MAVICSIGPNQFLTIYECRNTTNVREKNASYLFLFLSTARIRNNILILILFKLIYFFLFDKYTHRIPAATVYVCVYIMYVHIYIHWCVHRQIDVTVSGSVLILRGHCPRNNTHVSINHSITPFVFNEGNKYIKRSTSAGTYVNKNFVMLNELISSHDAIQRADYLRENGPLFPEPGTAERRFPGHRSTSEIFYPTRLMPKNRTVTPYRSRLAK